MKLQINMSVLNLITIVILSGILINAIFALYIKYREI